MTQEDNDNVLFMCPICGRSETSVGIMVHVEKAHYYDREPGDCAFCGKKYSKSVADVGIIELRLRATEHLDHCVNYASSMLAGRIVK